MGVERIAQAFQQHVILKYKSAPLGKPDGADFVSEV